MRHFSGLRASKKNHCGFRNADCGFKDKYCPLFFAFCFQFLNPQSKICNFFLGVSMAANTIDWLVQRCAKERFLFVLVSLLGFLILSPLFRGFTGLKNLLDIFLSLVLISSVYAVSQKRSDFIIAILLVFPLFLSTWTNYFIESSALYLIGICSGILFFAFMTITVLSFVLKKNRVTLNVIYAAIVVYIFIAFMWAFLFSLVEILQSGSITMTATDGNLFHFLYYSFVTITTLGYGDITPTSEIARSLSMIEAVIGQIYLVVLISRLMGIHIAQSMKE
jgi:hypothetical protein